MAALSEISAISHPCLAVRVCVRVCAQIHGRPSL